MYYVCFYISKVFSLIFLSVHRTLSIYYNYTYTITRISTSIHVYLSIHKLYYTIDEAKKDDENQRIKQIKRIDIIVENNITNAYKGKIAFSRKTSFFLQQNKLHSTIVTKEILKMLPTNKYKV